MVKVNLSNFFVCLIVFSFVFSMVVFGQSNTLKGTVEDANGVPLTGVNVLEKGTTNGTVTDLDGKFSLRVSESAVVVFSYIGFLTQEIRVTDSQTITVTLIEDFAILDELVVVGYGTQRKINLTGAVEQVSSKDLENRSMPNLSRGLQGLIPNLNITMYDGNPIRSPEYNVRGITSIGSGGAALVLIDGVEGDPSMINPNDIETITVLKDASSAAVYGARGSYGVVLITTKSPYKDQKTQISYAANYSIYKRTIVPDLVTDGYTWASHFNKAHTSWYGQNPTAINSAFPFSQEYLAELKKREADPSLPKIEINPTNGRYVYYDSHNWLKELYKDSHSGTEHNLNISKSSDKSLFLLSGRFFTQDGIYLYNSDKYNAYNFRAKASTKLYPWLEVTNNFDYSKQDYKEPLYYGGWGFTSQIVMGWSMRAFPVSPMLNPDGTITEMGARSIGDLYYGKNIANTHSSALKNSLSFSTNFFNDSFHVNGDFSFSRKAASKDRTYSAVPYNKSPNKISWLGNSRYFNHKLETDYIALNLYADYATSINKHNFKFLAGLNNESYSNKYLEVSRDGLLFPDRPSFTLSSGSNYETIDSITEWYILGLFYRINYDYDNRYLLEINGRYDGSSKFPERERWGYFPSISGGWRISEEPFWNAATDFISNLKIRASYGSLGNGNIEPYLYLESMPVSLSNRIINGSYPTITRNPNVVPNSLTWEKVTTSNIGLDLDMFNYRLRLNADVYLRKTENMFTQGPTLPEVFGAPIPKGNYADLNTTGWELVLSWRDQIGSSKPLSYHLRFSLADNISKITKYYNPTKNLKDYYEGMTMGEIWGYETEGFFRDQQDIDNHANQNRYRSNNSGIILPGDIKFKDINNDHVISYGNYTVENHGDLKIIGNSLPRYTYGVQADLNWNNLSLSVFFQGVGKRDWYPPSESFYFWGQYNRPYSPLPTSILNNYYDADPANPNLDAYFPRYSGLLAYNATGSLKQVQTKYLQDVSYIRLKNISLTYTLPDAIVKKIHADDISLFVTGQNLWTYSALFKHSKNIDPETIESVNPDTGKSAFGGGNGYPMLKNFTFGINLTF